VILVLSDAISAYHYWCCEFESRSGWGVQHYVIKFISDLVFNSINTIVADIEDNIRIYRLPSGRGTDHEIDISLASGSDNIIFNGTYQWSVTIILIVLSTFIHHSLTFSVLKFLLMLIEDGPKTVHRPVAPVYTWFLDRSISATQSVSRNSEGYMAVFYNSLTSPPDKCVTGVFKKQ
jgi:hypothetical protein